MCGIFGYLGKNAAVHAILLHGLERLEYRGYDSAGICVANDHESFIIKAVGKVSQVSQKVQNLLSIDKQFTIGIAHTRWATHG
ncbi:hypothetical protein KBC03_05840 [Patescibacteria group bacterium]|nr:hypothetical protein [Patescibacteria group bacterium]